MSRKPHRVHLEYIVDNAIIVDVDGIDRAYRAYGDLIYRRSLASLGELADAEDVVHEVFLEALEAVRAGRQTSAQALRVRARRISRTRPPRPPREILTDIPVTQHHESNMILDRIEARALLREVWSSFSPTQRRHAAYELEGYVLKERALRLRHAPRTARWHIEELRQRARKVREGWRVALAAVLSRTRRRPPGAPATVGVPVASALAAVAILVGGVATSTPGGVGLAPHKQTSTGHVTAPPRRWSPPSSPNDHALEQSIRTPRPWLLAALPSSPTRLLGMTIDETPEDTYLIAATRSPRYERDHTIIAVGVGQACGCGTLFRSTDGGATWATAPGPMIAASIVLPPSYPEDPRIFIGQAPNGHVPDLVASAFGQPFLPVPLPPGQLALSPAFDSGDPEVLIAATGAVWTYDTATTVASPLLATASRDETASVAAGSLDSDGIFVLAPSATIRANASGDAPTSRPTLFNCARGACATVASVPLDRVGNLVLSPAYKTDRTVLAYWDAEMAASDDGGHSFVRVDPADVAGVASATLESDRGTITVWSVVAQSNLGLMLRRSDLWHPTWVTELSDNADPATNGRIVSITARRVLFLVDGHGMRCSIDGGHSWRNRCPPERP